MTEQRKPRKAAGSQSWDMHNGRHRVRQTIEGRRYAAEGTTKAQALRNLNAKIQAPTEARKRTNSSPTLSEWLDRWIAQKAGEGLRHTTIARYQGLVKNHINPLLGEVRLADIRATTLNDFLSRMTDGNKRLIRSAQHARSLLHESLKAAEVDELIQRNPVELSTRPRYRRSNRPRNTADEVRRMLHATVGQPMYLRLLLGYVVGLRQGEALGLRWADIDFGRNVICIKGQVAVTKGKREWIPITKTANSKMEIPMDDHVRDAFMRHREIQDLQRKISGTKWQETGYVITTNVGTSPWPSSDLSEWRRIQMLVGATVTTVHDARGTCATLAQENGASLQEVKELLRHTSITTTSNFYTSRTPELALRAQHAVSRALLDAPVGSEERVS